MSSGVGGNPVRSKVTRRRSAQRSAGNAGSSAVVSRRARMNRSTGVIDQPLSFTGGIGGSLSGRNDQNSRAFVQSIGLAPAVVPVRGSGSPILTQASRSAIAPADSF